MKNNKQAQIHMSETLAVLFIFFVLVLFGLIFYYQYSKVSFKEEQEQIWGKKAIDLSLKTLFLPELVCSKGEAEFEDNCFDLIKLRQVNQTFFNHFGEYYSDLFPFAKITVNKLYPGTPEEWVLYDKPKTKKLEDGSVVRDWVDLKSTFFVVALKDEIAGLKGEGEYSFGVLTVGVYS